MKTDEMFFRRKTKGIYLTDVLFLWVSAFIVRLVWIFSRAWEAGDTPDYLAIAHNLAFNHAFSLSNPGSGPLVPTANRPPLLPWVVAMLWRTDAPPFYSILILQALLGAATVCLVYAVARDSFNRKVAIIASLGMIFAPMTCYFTAVVLTETLFTFFLVLAVFFWGRKCLVLSGIAFGFAALARPTIVPFLILLPLLFLVPALRSRWRESAVIAVIALMISGVWIVRNAIVFREFIPISVSGWGTNLLCGTLDTELVGTKVWTGTEWALLDLYTQPLLEVDMTLRETERERVRFRRGVERIRERPFHWLVVRAEQYPKLFLDSGNYALGERNRPVGEALQSRDWFVLIVKAIFVLGNILLLAVCAIGVYFERKRIWQLIHLVSFPGFFLLVQLPVWTESRYSLPIMPIFAMFFAVGCTTLAARYRLPGALSPSHV
jgi:4-amino-4-deoxy-L-arabinose transferase-like glycosyltransferase